MAGKFCWIETKDIDQFLAYRKLVRCEFENARCCPEGCCVVNPLTWEIIGIAFFLSMSIFICLCCCYYFKNKCYNNKIHSRNQTTISAPSTQNDERADRQEVFTFPTAPPSYDVAVLIPSDRVPSYEEVMTEKQKEACRNCRSDQFY